MESFPGTTQQLAGMYASLTISADLCIWMEILLESCYSVTLTSDAAQ